LAFFSSLGYFAKLRKVTISFLMSVCLSIHMEQLGSLKFTFENFWKYVENVQVSLKSIKNNGYFTWRPMHVYDYIWLSS